MPRTKPAVHGRCPVRAAGAGGPSWRAHPRRRRDRRAAGHNSQGNRQDRLVRRALLDRLRSPQAGLQVDEADLRGAGPHVRRTQQDVRPAAVAQAAQEERPPRAPSPCSQPRLAERSAGIYYNCAMLRACS